MRRAYDRLKLCVFGKVNEDGDRLLIPMLPIRLANVASLAVS